MEIICKPFIQTFLFFKLPKYTNSSLGGSHTIFVSELGVSSSEFPLEVDDLKVYGRCSEIGSEADFSFSSFKKFEVPIRIEAFFVKYFNFVASVEVTNLFGNF